MVDAGQDEPASVSTEGGEGQASGWRGHNERGADDRPADAPASRGRLQDESDEEGEVKEAGIPRDLREVIKGKRTGVGVVAATAAAAADKQRPKSNFDMPPDEAQAQPPQGGPPANVNLMRNNVVPAGVGLRREDLRRGLSFGKRGGGPEEVLVRRRGPSPFRPSHSVSLTRRISPPRRVSPPLARRGFFEERGEVRPGPGFMGDRLRSRSRERLERVREPSPPLMRREMSPRLRREMPVGGMPHFRREMSPHLQRRELSPHLQRREISPHFRRDVSPRLVREVSPHLRRDLSPRLRRDLSPPLRRELSPRLRRDMGVFDGEISNRQCTVHLTNLPPGVSLDRVRAALHNECERFGRVVDMQLYSRGNDRDAHVMFAEPGMAESARRGMHRAIILNTSIDVLLDGNGAVERTRDRAPISQLGGEARRRPPEPFDDMHDPLATCRVGVDDLDEGVLEGEVVAAFKHFGYIESVEVQRFRDRAMAFIKFRALSSAVRARREMDGQRIGDRRCRVDYAMGKASNQIWVGSVHASVSESEVVHQFSRFGRVVEASLNRPGKCAYVLYENVEDAEVAAQAMRGRTLSPSSWRIKIDFAEGRFPGKVGGGSGGGLQRQRSPLHPPVSQQPPPPPDSASVLVTLDKEVNEKALHSHFKRYGTIVDIQRDLKTLTAIIYFERKGSAQDAAEDREGPRLGVPLGITRVEVNGGGTISLKRRRESMRGERDGGSSSYESKRPHVDTVSSKFEGTSSTISQPSNSDYPEIPHPAGYGGQVEPATAEGYVESPQVAYRPSQVAGYDVGVVYAGHSPHSNGYDQTVVGSSRNLEYTHTGELQIERDQLTPATTPHAIPSVMVLENPPVYAPVEMDIPVGLNERLLVRFPQIWNGCCALKATKAPIVLHQLRRGEGDINTTIPGDSVSITQRMRLELEQMTQFSQRMQNQHPSVLIAVAAGDLVEERQQNETQFQTYVKYLKERNSAGVVVLPMERMMYLFPPGDVAEKLLSDVCTDLDVSQESTFLVAVILSGQA